jgi:hypothetical protein
LRPDNPVAIAPPLAGRNVRDVSRRAVVRCLLFARAMRSRLFQTIVVVGASLTAGCASNPIAVDTVVDGGSPDLTGDLVSWPIIAVDLHVWPPIDASWPTIMVPGDMSRPGD